MTALTPVQEAAVRRWCTHAGLSPITPLTWVWLLTLDRELADFLTWPEERLSAHCAECDEAPDGPDVPQKQKTSVLARLFSRRDVAA